MTQDELVTLCAEWQKRLRLQDWIVKPRIARKFDFVDRAQGQCNWTIETKIATILILDPIDYPRDTLFEQDLEQTLVHELLHLHLAGVLEEDNRANEITIEQAIDCTAMALVQLRRETMTCQQET